MTQPSKKTNVDDVLLKAQQTTQKTRELLKRADTLHAEVETAHKKADQLHTQLRSRREKGRKASERKARAKT